jgi:HD-GYP domain-containing protein (c-di-GMP phosphodiesterase class II)
MLGLLGGLAAVTDLGTGSASDESLRRCLVAVRLAREIGCGPDTVRHVTYASLLQHLGCTAYAHELARDLGDDIAVTRVALSMDGTGPRDVVGTWIPGLAVATGRTRLGATVATARHLRSVDAAAPVATCEVAREASRRLGLAPAVQECLATTTAQWDGHGYPPVAGDSIPLPTRLMHVAGVAVQSLGPAGLGQALAQVRRRSGSHLDPEIADLFLARAGELLDGVAEVDPFDAVLDAEPDPVRRVDSVELTAVARTFGDLVDLKSPRLQGHSAAVADLAARAATHLGLDDGTVRVAGHLHDIGRAAVPSTLWSKSAPLSVSEQDRTRLHAYHSERILARIPELTHLAVLAGQHHERCDGSGYHRGLTADRTTLESRVLATADTYRTLLEDRPGRAPLTAAEAVRRLRDAARTGRLDGDAVEAVLDAAGHRAHARPGRPGDLTARQVEVLRLVAAGLSNREIAARLVVARRTAEHHVQDVYRKIGASSRAAAALYAMEHGLLAPR